MTLTFTCVCHSTTWLLQLAVTVSHYTVVVAAAPHPLHLPGHSHIPSRLGNAAVDYTYTPTSMGISSAHSSAWSRTSARVPHGVATTSLRRTCSCGIATHPWGAVGYYDPISCFIDIVIGVIYSKWFIFGGGFDCLRISALFRWSIDTSASRSNGSSTGTSCYHGVYTCSTCS